jgi:low affinity Fe/Cu permease
MSSISPADFPSTGISEKSAGAFSRFAKWTARMTGKPVSFGLAALVVLAWIVTGPLFGFSDTWQLVINTGTTIITFLMVFLIQSTQNSDTQALQIKLDELIRVTAGAHNALLDLEELEEEDLRRIRAKYERLAQDARNGLAKGVVDTDSPDLLEDEEV